MNRDRDRQIGKMLEHVAVPPAAGFWRDLDVLLQLEDAGGDLDELDGRGATGEPNAQPDVIAPDVIAPDVIEPAVPDLEDNRNRRRQLPFLAAAAVIVVVATIGLMQVDRAGDPNLIAGPGLENTPDGEASDTTTTSVALTTLTTLTEPTATDTAAEPTNPTENDFTGPLTRRDNADGSFAGLEIARPGETIVIPTTHSLDVAGMPLMTEFVSDGNGGFLYGLVDYDDSRPDRSSRLLHVPANADRPLVVATEEQDGIQDVLGVVEDPTGTLVVYTTMLGTRTRTVPLTGGTPKDVSLGEGVAVGGDIIVVVNNDDCRSLSLLDPRGEPSTVASPRSAEACGPSSPAVHEQGLSPDGKQIAWLEDGDRLLRIVDLSTSEMILEKDLGDSGFHITRFDGYRVLLMRAGPSEFEPTVVDVHGEMTSDPSALAAVTWDHFQISPDLVLGLPS